MNTISPTGPTVTHQGTPCISGDAAESFSSIFHPTWKHLPKATGLSAAEAFMKNAGRHLVTKLPREEVRGSGAESYTYLPRSLDVEVVEPFQDRNPGHHPNGGVVKVAVQHLNDAIEV